MKINLVNIPLIKRGAKASRTTYNLVMELSILWPIFFCTNLTSAKAKPHCTKIVAKEYGLNGLNHSLGAYSVTLKYTHQLSKVITSIGTI